jgi:hypothetical protein
MRATTPVQLGQQCQRNEGNKDAIAMVPKMRQRCQHDKGDNASAIWVTMPVQHGQQCQRDNAWQLPLLLLSSSLLLGCVCHLLQG